jgi:hypothetical protein
MKIYGKYGRKAIVKRYRKYGRKLG